jgi:Tfp pilus assembly protein PilN
VRPLHLNLAARPYRDYRPVYAVVVALSLLIAFLMLNNIDTYYRYVSETKTTRAKIAQLDRQADTEQARAQASDALVRNIDTAALDEDARFINNRLAQRAFSWSELLDRLEGVLPSDVRIKTISPSFDKSGMVHLELACDAKDTNGTIETINRFNHDPHFANPFPHSESQSTGNTYMFSIAVDYKPSMPRPTGKQ